MRTGAAEEEIAPEPEHEEEEHADSDEVSLLLSALKRRQIRTKKILFVCVDTHQFALKRISL